MAEGKKGGPSINKLVDEVTDGMGKVSSSGAKMVSGVKAKISKPPKGRGKTQAAYSRPMVRKGVAHSTGARKLKGAYRKKS